MNNNNNNNNNNMLTRLQSGKPVNETRLLDETMARYMVVQTGTEKIRQNYPVLNIRSHDVVLRTKTTLQKICDFLHVTCRDDYLDACASIVFAQPSVTRNLVVWTDQQKRWLLNEMQKYSCLKEYTFEDYPK